MASNPDEVEVGSNPDAVSAVRVEVEVVLVEAVLVEVVVVEVVVVETMTRMMTRMTMTTKAVPFPHPDAWIKTVYNVNCKFC